MTLKFARVILGWNGHIRLQHDWKMRTLRGDMTSLVRGETLVETFVEPHI